MFQFLNSALQLPTRPYPTNFSRSNRITQISMPITPAQVFEIPLILLLQEILKRAGGCLRYPILAARPRMDKFPRFRRMVAIWIELGDAKSAEEGGGKKSGTRIGVVGSLCGDAAGKNCCSDSYRLPARFLVCLCIRSVFCTWTSSFIYWPNRLIWS